MPSGWTRITVLDSVIAGLRDPFVNASGTLTSEDAFLDAVTDYLQAQEHLPNIRNNAARTLWRFAGPNTIEIRSN